MGWTREQQLRLVVATVSGLATLGFGFWAAYGKSSRLEHGAVAVVALIVGLWNARSIPYTE